jgi:hypothetical protein
MLLSNIPIKFVLLRNPHFLKIKRFYGKTLHNVDILKFHQAVFGNFAKNNSFKGTALSS